MEAVRCSRACRRWASLPRRTVASMLRGSNDAAEPGSTGRTEAANRRVPTRAADRQRLLADNRSAA